MAMTCYSVFDPAHSCGFISNLILDAAAGKMSHSLKDRWFLSFLPNITQAMVQQDYGGKWKEAQQKLLRPIDFITTIEELWSTFNSLPKVANLAAGDTIILARNDKEASFEAFPHGKRVLLTVYTSVAADKAVDVVLAAVIGEQLMKVCDMESTCDVIRMAHKPSYQYKDCVRIELWLSSARHAESIIGCLKDQLKEKGVAQFDLKETNLE